MKPFWKLLDKQQVKHLRESRIRNVRQFWEARDYQRSTENTVVDDLCKECRAIEMHIRARSS